jgi:tetratricopeptide (TPR) repeat protein
MSNVAKLKRKASEFEQKKQYDRALETYLDVVSAADGTDEVDIPLYNRIGDLYLRGNNTEDAVKFYEKAVDLY